MQNNETYLAIGLMSGTSMDGIDAALIETDGVNYIKSIGFTTVPIDPDLKISIQAALGANKSSPDKLLGKIERLEKEMTLANCDAIRELLYVSQRDIKDVNIIGFHGHTITHDPDNGFTWQIGDGELMSKEMGCPVICNFREKDVAEGGQGAPLIPLFHQALLSEDKLPCCILNIGGVANITWVGSKKNEDLIAFDTGIGNALLDDFMAKRVKTRMDKGGELSLSGTVQQDYLMRWLRSSYFDKAPPKSLDRQDFELKDLRELPDADGAATLSAFTAFSVQKSLKFIPGYPETRPKSVYVSGGGRHNKAMMEWLERTIDFPVKNIDELGWNGDAIEAEGFAYLAVRRLKDLPTSLPNTTGVKTPCCGGDLFSDVK